MHPRSDRLPELLQDHHAQPPELGSGGDLAVARIAAGQRGLVTRAQLAALGLRRGAIAHRIAEGRLHRLHRGVYAVGHPVLMPFAGELAALLACGERAILSHRSAAAVWQLSAPAIGEVEVTLVGCERGSRPGIRSYGVATLDHRDLRRREGLLLTSPARTLLDLGAVLPARALEQAVAEARARRLVTPGSLEAALARAPQRHGVAALRALLRRETGVQLTRSEAEERLLKLIRNARLPEPECNVRVGRYEVDFLWRAQRLVVEVDGYAFHSSPAAFERDRLRDAEIEDDDYRVRRVTWRQLTEDAPGVERRLRRALARRSPTR